MERKEASEAPEKEGEAREENWGEGHVPEARVEFLKKVGVVSQGQTFLRGQVGQVEIKEQAD